MAIRYRTLLLPFLIGALAAAPAYADDTSDAERRVQDALQSTLVRLVDAGEVSPDDLATLRLESPASRLPVFGAVVDTRLRAENERDGFPVVAVTPGGSADALGLRVGDRVLDVNDETLLGLGVDAGGHVVAAQRLRAAMRDGTETLTLRVRRGGDVVTLQGAVRMVELPAYRLELGDAVAGAFYAAPPGSVAGDGVSSCGRISVFDAAPRGRKIYPAVLIAIDGQTPGPSSSASFRVEPGTRRLTVAEAIDTEQFSGLQQTQRNRPARERYKDLVVNVRPGVTYRLGAQFNLEHRNRIRENAYWEPVIWSEAAETCR